MQQSEMNAAGCKDKKTSLVIHRAKRMFLQLTKGTTDEAKREYKADKVTLR